MSNSLDRERFSDEIQHKENLVTGMSGPLVTFGGNLLVSTTVGL